MREKKLHLQDKSETSFWPLCNVGSNARVTPHISQVNCGNCLRMAVNKTTEQGGQPDQPKEKLYYLVLEANGANRIATIKLIREITSLGLKESKDLSDIVQYDKKPTTVLYEVPLEEAQKAASRFQDNGDRVSILDASTGQALGTISVHQAYQEMMNLFFPEDIQDRSAYLDNFDDDEKTGHRLWTMANDNCPRMSDIRRWLAAGGAK